MLNGGGGGKVLTIIFALLKFIKSIVKQKK